MKPRALEITSAESKFKIAARTESPEFTVKDLKVPISILDDVLSMIKPTRTLGVILGHKEFTKETDQILNRLRANRLEIYFDYLTYDFLEAVDALQVPSKFIFANYLSSLEKWTNEKLGAFSHLFPDRKYPTLQ